MNYFIFEPNKEMAIDYWHNAQFDLCDIVLSLTDMMIMHGAKIYAIFNRQEVLNLMQYFVCDFEKIKEDLFIGEYVERSGDVYSNNFNPKRNKKAVTLSCREMKARAKLVYENIMRDLYEIAMVR